MLCLVAVVGATGPPVSAEEKVDDLVLGWYVSGLGGMIDREWSFGGDAFLDLSIKGFRMAVGVPFRFDAGGFRKEHWDETGDFGRLIREISYQRTDLRLFLAIHPVSKTSLGVGNLVSHFDSVVDADHWSTGFTGSYYGDYGGVDVFLDSLLAPSIVGGRIHVRPFEAIHPGGFVGRLEIGGTLVADFRAPAEFQRLGRPIILTGKNLPQVHQKRLIGAGIDVRWPVYQAEAAEVVPYFAMSMVESGSGLHLGIALDIKTVESVRFGLVGEWRYLGAGYVAPYFDSLYMVDRYDFASTNPYNAKTKARILDDVLDVRMGAMAGVFVEVKDVATTWIQLDWDNQGQYTQLRFGLDLDILDLVGVRLSFAERGIPAFRKLFDPDRFVFAAVLDVDLTKNVTIFGSYSREVSIRRSGMDVGLYRPTDGFLIGVRGGFQYEKGANGKSR